MSFKNAKRQKPGFLKKQQQLIQQLIGDRPNLHSLQIDATHPADFLPLTHYFQSEKPVTVLCEGLLMYLTLAEKQQVFENVRSLLQTYGGVWITPDITTKTASWLRNPDLQKVYQNIASGNCLLRLVVPQPDWRSLIGIICGKTSIKLVVLSRNTGV